jgi:hypothetical protein
VTKEKTKQRKKRSFMGDHPYGFAVCRSKAVFPEQEGVKKSDAFTGFPS